MIRVISRTLKEFWKSLWQLDKKSILSNYTNCPTVGVDFHTYDGIFQGSRSHILGLFKRAIGLAPELHFVFFLNDPDALRSAHREFDAPNVSLVQMRHAAGPIRLGLQLPWLRWRHKIDLLHTQYRIPLVPLGACACTIHDVLFESYPEYFTPLFTLQSKLTFRRAARRASLLFTVSEYSRGEIARRYSIDLDRINVIYNGVDRTRFFPGLEGADRLQKIGLEPAGYLLTVGRIEPRKNHVRLIEAYASLGEKVPPLVCVGQRDFGYAPALEAAVRFGVKDRVHFLENVSDDLLPVLMRHAQLFVFPAIVEGFGMPVAEALASGVPVVASRSSGILEVAGDVAVLVDPLDVASIARGMRNLLADESLERRFCIEGVRQTIRFDWGASALSLVNTYREFFSNRVAVPRE